MSTSISIHGRCAGSALLLLRRLAARLDRSSIGRGIAARFDLFDIVQAEQQLVLEHRFGPRST
ncbi:hypothetical protein HNR60_004348 [Rhodopseudomonas rhenobacensis]|uniref:Uncharacterized protein n=1 Tax=Rhodopseudomonas rhenobacensis TaxID=87461 RepID=A0A7W7Z7U5_9BRAD|nr:hypothetical protein [Rhodopseudomonas rhenobacensis]